MNQEIRRLYDILVEMLGESKTGYSDGQFEYEFACPCCVEKYGAGEVRKYNLSISLSKQRMNCWKCSSEGEKTHGTVLKLIRMYGNDALLSSYMAAIRSIRESELYKLNFTSSDFNVDTTVVEKEELRLPESFKFFKKGEPYDVNAFNYLKNRGIGWDIIEKYKLGYTGFQEENKKQSFRVIIPSYNEYGELNYWVGRDYLSGKKYTRMKYDNPKTEKKDIIFNEDKIQWDADITLVEGPFDHIVVPNSVPLLGKALNPNYKLYWDLITKCNAGVNLWLDDDVADGGREIYSLLNHGRLYGKIRRIDGYLGKDPSEIYEKYGHKGITNCLRTGEKIPEYELFY